MWFLIGLQGKFEDLTDRFLEAYYEVYGWTWPLNLLSTPLYWIYYHMWYVAYYFGEFNTWLTWAAGRIGAILSSVDIWSLLEWWLTAAQNAWNWVINATSNIWGVITSWWSSTQYTVLAWVDEAKSYAASLVNNLSITVNILLTAWDNFKGMIPTMGEVITWWSDWTMNLQVTIDTWWTGALTEVQGLINSAFLERESWWAGWSDFRDQVATFFSDPLEFLWDRFTDWFLGPEE